MAWDLRIDPMTGDLITGIVTGSEEVLQRLVTRLRRELGEWFLATNAGLPWYQEGRGLLGSKNKKVLILLLRSETRKTEGVERILRMNTLFLERSFSIYMLLLLSSEEKVQMTLTEQGAIWRME